jgi:pimeloyl-ACP methyl ester carboxylesterase
MRHLVTTSFGQMHVRVAGEGGTPLVLLHMSPRSSRMFGPLQQALGRRSYAPDRLGYGFSDPPSRPLTLGEYASTVLEALDELRVDGPVDVLGMHTGSLEAIELGHLAGPRVRRIGVVALPVFTAEERLRGLDTYARLEIVPREDGSHLLEAWRARFQYRKPPFDLEDIQRRFVDYVLTARPGQAYDAVFRYDAGGRLGTLRQPLIVFAPVDDLAAITGRSRDLVPPGTEWIELPDLGIDLFTNAGPRLAGLIDRYFGAG